MSAVAIRTRITWQRDTLKVTVPDRDGSTHLAYSTALATLCGRLLSANKVWAFLPEESGEFSPDCDTCREILARFVEERLERRGLLGGALCAGITRKGEQCARQPIYGSKWCNSHHPEARLYGD